MKKNLFYALMLLFFALSSVSTYAQTKSTNNDDEESDAPRQQVQYVKRKTVHVNDDKPYPSLIFCYYPLASIAGNFKVGLERKLSNVTSIKTNLRFGYGDKSNFYSYQDNSNYNNGYYYSSYSNYSTSNFSHFVMGMLEMQYRYYFADKAPQGLYGGLYGYYKMANFNYNMYSYSYDASTQTSTSSNVTKTKFLNGGGLGILLGAQVITQSKFAVDAYMGTGLSFSSPDGDKLKGLNGAADKYFNGITFIMGANVGLGLKK